MKFDSIQKRSACRIISAAACLVAFLSLAPMSSAQGTVHVACEPSNGLINGSWEVEVYELCPPPDTDCGKARLWVIYTPVPGAWNHRVNGQICGTPCWRVGSEGSFLHSSIVHNIEVAYSPLVITALDAFSQPIATQTCSVVPGSFPTGCGNAIREVGEECDDGNRASGDGCSATCVDEFCGDGIVQPGIGEECDSGDPSMAECCAFGCTYEPQGTLCVGGIDLCNGSYTCDGLGACAPGPPDSCDDNNECTVNACLDPLVGCIVQATHPPHLCAKSEDSRNQAGFLAAQQLGAAAAGLALGTACLAVAGPAGLLCAIISGASTSHDLLAAAFHFYIALDPPDMNYTVVEQPVVPPYAQISTNDGASLGEVSAWNALFANSANQIAFARAYLTAIERADGAAIDEDFYWRAEQSNAARIFAGQLATSMFEQEALRQAAAAASEAAGRPTVSVTASDIANAQSDVAANGLPNDVAQSLVDLGATASEIADIEAQLAAVNLSGGDAAFPDYIADAGLISEIDAAALAYANIAGIAALPSLRAPLALLLVVILAALSIRSFGSGSKANTRET